MNNRLIIFICLCLIGCHIAGDSLPIEKDGALYGKTKGLFRHRWWNYYERGASFADGEFWAEAEADFRKALSMNGKDQSRVRTYGWHVTDYFPHRELGVVLFFQKQYPAAIAELEASLSTEKTAKAEFYLDRSRQAQLEQTGEDVHPPEISVALPEFPVNFQKIQIAGTATDDTFVKEIFINGHPVRIDLSAPRIEFKQEVPLQNGENRITVEANDLTGKSSRWTKTVICDRTGPIINIDELTPEPGKPGYYILNGYVLDRSGIKEIRVDDHRLITEPATAELILHHPIRLPVGQSRAAVIAEDIAGNITRADVRIPETDSADASPSHLFASLTLAQGASYRGMMTPEKKVRRYTGAGTDYAVIIGINRYAEWEHLKTAVNDVQKLKQVLTERYGYLHRNILMITDEEASGQNLLQTLGSRAMQLKETDNLLIYFAGHGELDKITGDGYWIPADGKRDDPSTWVTHSAVRNILCSDKVRGKNIVVVADSCYSGTMLLQETDSLPSSHVTPGTAAGKKSGVIRSQRSSLPLPAYQETILERAKLKSRQVVSSGGIEPVSDDGENLHSLFAYHFIRALISNQERVMDLERLFYAKVWEPVAEKGGQRPAMNRFKSPADQGGQFVFILGDAVAASEIPDAFQQSFRLPDTEPPEITIRDWAETQTVFLDQAFIQIHVQDSSGIRSVTVNGQKIMNRPGRDLYLNHLMPLAEGKNPITVECVDQLGNRKEMRFQIHRKLQKVYETGIRMSAALFPVYSEGFQNAAIENNLINELFKSKRFAIKERKRNRKKYHEDENKDIQELARQTGADFVFKTYIEGNKKQLSITIRVVEAETLDMITVQGVYGEDPDAVQINTLCQGLVVKLRNELPLCQGDVAAVKEDTVIVTIGEEAGIKKGMHLVFFKEEPIFDPKTGISLGSDSKLLGDARISRLTKNIAYAVPIKNEKPKYLQVGDQVVMK